MKQLTNLLKTLNSGNDSHPIFKMGFVTGVSDEGLTIDFGLRVESQITHITSYNPLVGDAVLVLYQGGNAIVLGKIKTLVELED